jgi:Holliday junction resolvase-like predicted endonuclease
VTSRNQSRALGTHGEQLVYNLLKNNDFLILKRNYHLRGAEIDLIAIKNKKVIIAEVKTRNSASPALKQAMIIELLPTKKIASLKKGALHFLANSPHLQWHTIRLDLFVAIYFGDSDTFKIHYFPNITAGSSSLTGSSSADSREF